MNGGGSCRNEVAESLRRRHIYKTGAPLLGTDSIPSVTRHEVAGGGDCAGHLVGRSGRFQHRRVQIVLPGLIGFQLHRIPQELPGSFQTVVLSTSPTVQGPVFASQTSVIFIRCTQTFVSCSIRQLSCSIRQLSCSIRQLSCSIRQLSCSIRQLSGAFCLSGAQTELRSAQTGQQLHLQAFNWLPPEYHSSTHLFHHRDTCNVSVEPETWVST